MKIGTMFLGEVEAIGGQSVQTKFFVLGLPLFPIQSFYVLHDAGARINGLEIPLHGKSVLAGYSRVLTGTALAIASVFLYLEHFDFARAGFWVPVTAALFIGSMFLGRVGGEEKALRRRLHSMTGVFAHPRTLGSAAAQPFFDALETKWSARYGDVSWREKLRAGAVPAVSDDLVFALAAYSEVVRDSTV
jgi:hypothetical protein